MKTEIKLERSLTPKDNTYNTANHNNVRLKRGMCGLNWHNLHNPQYKLNQKNLFLILLVIDYEHKLVAYFQGMMRIWPYGILLHYLSRSVPGHVKREIYLGVQRPDSS